MMEEKKTIFDYLTNVFAQYGCTVFIFIIFGLVIGDDVYDVSSLFVLGRAGLAYSTLIQLFVMSVFITIYRYLFFTDAVIRNMTLVTRTVCMLGAVTVTIVLFVVIFDWFPANQIGAWIGFVISFAVCFGVSAGITSLREKLENRKMEEALKKVKED